MSRVRAEKRAQELLNQYKVVRPPVPVEKLARNEGLEILYEPFPDDSVSGMLIREGENPPAIIVNSADAPVRQRFTIAHELAHFFLAHRQKLYVDSHLRVSFRDSESGLATKREEVEANQFAAALLIPEEMVDSQVNSILGREPNLSDDDLIDRLRIRFEVSNLAMQYRLINLGHIGAV